VPGLRQENTAGHVLGSEIRLHLKHFAVRSDYTFGCNNTLTIAVTLPEALKVDIAEAVQSFSSKCTTHEIIQELLLLTQKIRNARD